VVVSDFVRSAYGATGPESLHPLPATAGKLRPAKMGHPENLEALQSQLRRLEASATRENGERQKQILRCAQDDNAAGFSTFPK